MLVIGGGNSGCDIACESARVAPLRPEPAHRLLVPAQDRFGKPLSDLPIWGLPVLVQRLILRSLVRIFIGDYRRYGLQRPSHKLFERHPAFGTDVFNYLRQGRIKPRPRYRALFRDQGPLHRRQRRRIRSLVSATGFNNSIPFLPKNLVRIENDIVQVYGGAFPDTVKNLYIVGWAQPRNGFGAIISPAAKLYAETIALQDEIELPIGYVLEWRGLKVPTDAPGRPCCHAPCDLAWRTGRCRC